MIRGLCVAALAGAIWLAAPAVAQQEPRFCPNSPSLESSACTTEPGRVHLEVTAIDWELDRDADGRSDTFLAADTLIRLGVGPATEVQAEWTPYGVVRERDGASGAITRRGRVGDLTLAVRQNLRNPDGSGLSYGLQPFVTLPVGRVPVGAGTWSAGLILPLTYDVTQVVNVGVTGELDAAADEEGHGRHFASNVVVAASFDLGAVSLTTETQVLRDDDPAGATTQWLGGLGLRANTGERRALYAEAVAGLNRDAPDVRLYGGMAMLF